MLKNVHDSLKFPAGKSQIFILVLLRMAIGWHLLYEGVSKLLMPDWTSAGYLERANWLFADFFHWIAGTPNVLYGVDLLNMWGLSLIGIALVIGCLTRFSGICGILLIALYYIANPPFIASGFGLPSEGHYLVVNKNLVEIIALGLVVIFPAGKFWALDTILSALLRRIPYQPVPKVETRESESGDASARLSRRQILESLASLPVLGIFAFLVSKKHNWNKVHAITGATIQATSKTLKDLKGILPMGKVGKYQVSRIILGGNLIGGWAHARDLIYVSSLFKAYNTEKKVFDTLMIAEKAGINTINISCAQLPLINKYKAIFGSKLQTVCQIYPSADKIIDDAQWAIDNGGDMIQIQGGNCDRCVKEGRIDILQKCLDHIRSRGYTAGLGAHAIEAVIACDKAGLEPDFYMKTIHHDRYWSAHPKENRIPFSVDSERSPNHNEFHDNIFCLFPEKTIAFMKNKKIPWMGFKVLAAGAIEPKDGFKYAFESGADFLCVGMFDYQIVDDVNTAIETLANVQNRQRPWCG
jgi:uncharacterized membrane protein YphA (DoxX/SURF4 family)